MIIDIKGITLGCGLIGIGRKWGYVDSPIPSEEDVLQFLSFAFENGIRYFDTAPSYGLSEERLGKFLQTLSSQERQSLMISTKFGEHWDKGKNDAYVDHSYDALVKSLEQSQSLLGKIDLLYLHKAHLQALQSDDVKKAFDYAKRLRITRFGASISDLDSAEYVLSQDLYSVLQFPYNSANILFAEIIDRVRKRGKIVVINRPFNMGQHAESKEDAFKFILQKQFNGYILTGTKSPKHLQENLETFNKVKVYEEK